MITLKEKFGATLILDEMLVLPNYWDVVVSLEPNAAFVDEPSSYNKAVDRIQVYVESILDNSIFVGPDHIKQFMNGLPFKGVIHTTPDMPYDHILTMCLFTKFTNIVEGRCFVTNVKLESYQAGGVQHSHGIDDGELDSLRKIYEGKHEQFADYWFDSRINYFDLDPDGVKLNTIDWDKFDLEFDKTKAHIVSLDNFRKNEFKPRIVPKDDDDNPDIA